MVLAITGAIITGFYVYSSELSLKDYFVRQRWIML